MPFHSFITGEPGWQVTGSEELFANHYLAVNLVSQVSPTRAEPFKWTVCHRKAAVVIAPRTADGHFLLIRQERAPIQRTIWEFPAGQIDEATDQDEAAIRATALRELQEESGYEPSPTSEVIPLGYFFPSPGFTDEHSHLLLITHVVLSPRGTALDEHEAISEARAFPPAELKRMLAEGEINDANTLAACARLMAKGLLS